MIPLAFRKLDLLKKILLAVGCLLSLILLGPYFGLHLFGTSPSQQRYAADTRTEASRSLAGLDNDSKIRESASTAREISGSRKGRPADSERMKNEKKNKLSEIEKLLK